MFDAEESINAGERRPVYAVVTTPAGTLQVQSAPAPQAALFDAALQPVGAEDSATGYDTAAASSVRVWQLVDAGALAAGYYALRLTFYAQGKDAQGNAEGFVRKYVRWIRVTVED